MSYNQKRLMQNVEEYSTIWKTSGSTPPAEVEFDPPRGKLVYLPYHVVPVWPNTTQCAATDTYYCVCVTCGTFTDKLVQVILDVDGSDSSWAVRIRCWACYPELLFYTSYCESILTVSDKLEPILSSANKKRDNTCEICEKQGTCDDPEQCEKTRQFIGRSETEDLLEYFYRTRVDVVTPLRFKICHRQSCNYVKPRMVNCQVCHRVCYCSEKCKRLDKSVHDPLCVSYYEVWRP